MSQFLKIFIMIALCWATSYAAEPSLFNSKQSVSSRSKHFPFKKRRHCSSSREQEIAPQGPPGPPGPQGPQGIAGPQGISGTNIFAFANLFLSSNSPVNIAFEPALGLGLIPYAPGVLTNITQDPTTSEAIISIPGNYVIDFTMTISNPSNIPTTYTVGIVRRNLLLGQTTFQTIQTYAIRIGDINLSQGGAFSLIGQDILALNVGDRITIASLSDPSLQLFGTPPDASLSAIDTPATFTIRLLDGS